MDFMAMIVSPDHRRNEWVRMRPGLLSGSLWALLTLGCSATSDPASGDLRQDLRHKDPRVRMEAAHQAGTKDRTDLVDLLVENLRDHDESVRFITAIPCGRSRARTSVSAPSPASSSGRRPLPGGAGGPESRVPQKTEKTAARSPARPRTRAGMCPSPAEIPYPPLPTR